MENYIIRKYESGDEKQIIRLFEEVYGKRMGKIESFKHWNWEYKFNPNKRIEIFLAFHNHKIIGQYAVIPVKMKIGNKDYITSLSLDTMTHKDYRGQGIFPILAKKLYSEIGKNGIPITYGFPNALSYPNFMNKLEWFEISDVPIYIRPLNFTSLLNHYLKIKFLSKIFSRFIDFFFNFTLEKKKMDNNLKIKKINEFGKEVDDLWKLTKKEMPICIVRDSKYLNWRYFKKPEEKYDVFAIKKDAKLKGYIILKIEERFDLKIGLIVDILTNRSNMAYQDYLIKYAISYFKKKKVDIVSVIMYPHCRYYKSLKKQKFLKLLKRLLPEDIYFGARLNNSKLNIQFIKNPINWHITWGDIDVV